MYEGQWQPFESAISGLKLVLADDLERDGKGRFELADCEVKSNWVRVRTEREKRSPFLHALDRDDMTSLTEAYFRQVAERHTVIMSSVIDKRYLNSSVTHETLHTTAYEFLLERIQHYMREYHPRHRAGASHFLGMRMERHRWSKAEQRFARLQMLHPKQSQRRVS